MLRARAARRELQAFDGGAHQYGSPGDHREYADDAASAAESAQMPSGGETIVFFSTLASAVAPDRSRTIECHDYAIDMRAVRALCDQVTDAEAWANLGKPSVRSFSEFMQQVDFSKTCDRPTRHSMHPVTVSLWYYAAVYTEKQLLESGTRVAEAAAFLLHVCLFSRDNIYVKEDARPNVASLLDEASAHGLVSLLCKREFVNADGDVPRSAEGGMFTRAIELHNRSSVREAVELEAATCLLISATPVVPAAVCSWVAAWSGSNVASCAASSLYARCANLRQQHEKVPLHYEKLLAFFVTCRLGHDKAIEQKTPAITGMFGELPPGIRFNIACLIGRKLPSPYSMTRDQLFMGSRLDPFLFADLMSIDQISVSTVPVAMITQ